MKLNGVLYKKPCAILLGVHEDFPQFAQVEDVFVKQNNTVVLLVKLFISHVFLHHYRGYKVCITEEYRIVCSQTLSSPLLFHVRRISTGDTVIVVKYHICGTLEAQVGCSPSVHW